MEIFMRDLYGIRHVGLFFGLHNAASQGYDTLGMNQSTPNSQQNQVKLLTTNQGLNFHPWSLVGPCPALAIPGGPTDTQFLKSRGAPTTTSGI